MAFKPHFAEEASWRTKRSAIYVSAKESIISACGHVGGMEMLRGAAAFVAGNAGGGNLLALVGVGTIGAISAGLTLLDHYQKLDHLAEDYAEEIAAKLKKRPQDVTRKDLEIVANGDPSRGIAPNYALREKLRHENKCMAFSVAFSVIASLGAIALAPLLVAAIPGLAAATGIVHLVASGLAGLLCYNAIKAPLHAVGDKLFGLDEQQTTDRIHQVGQAVEQGQNISREQVLSLYVGSNPELANFVQSRFGGEYDGLSTENQQRAATFMSRYLPLDAVCEAINNKRLCATELAFVLQGDMSGVPLDAWQTPPKSLIDQVIGKADHLLMQSGHKVDLTPHKPHLPHLAPQQETGSPSR